MPIGLIKLITSQAGNQADQASSVSPRTDAGQKHLLRYIRERHWYFNVAIIYPCI